jgi:glycine cleavage system H protein
MDDLKFHKEHTWVKARDGRAMIGITDYAQQQLGEILYLDLPEIGSAIRRGDPLCCLESSKVVTDVIAPLSGEVLEINPRLEETPGLINQSPYEQGWIARLSLNDPDELTGLMDLSDYEVLISSEGKGT